jgi:hypothetical protein
MSIVNWHSKLQVLSLDFHPVSGCLATAGADHEIKASQAPLHACFCTQQHY